MSKWKQFKEAVANPPPERLASIEYKSHMLSIIGVTVVCIFLILKGFWYIIFAFIFSVGVSYSQGVTAYRKYVMLKNLRGEEDPLDYEHDISPSRRRMKIVKYVYGQHIGWAVAMVSVIIAALTVDPTLNRWIYSLIMFLTIFLIYILFYFFILYYIANPIYKKRMKGGIGNDKKKKRT